VLVGYQDADGLDLFGPWTKVMNLDRFDVV